MGMFDYVRCEVPLPDGSSTEGLFQTKDFDCPYLETYVIRKDGRLIHNKPRYDIDPPEAVSGEVDTNHHGFLNFYDYDTTTSIWREYMAKFTDGQLVDIELVPERQTA